MSETKPDSSDTHKTRADAFVALEALWALAMMPSEALESIGLPGPAAVVPSSFAVSAAAQASLAAAALAAAEIWHGRQASGARQRVVVDATHAVVDSLAYFAVDGHVPDAWAKFSGLYRCGPAKAPGWVRIHANFDHHRDGALHLLGCATDGSAQSRDLIHALSGWSAEAFEAAAADAGLVVAAARSLAQWDTHPQAQAVANEPVLTIEPIARDSSAMSADAPPRVLPDIGPYERPLTGVRVLDLTRILAGPVAGRTLAAYGADVMLVNSPALPNIAAIADTSRGKRSALIDLKSASGARTLRELLGDAHVFLQAYRPGGMAELGFAPQDLARVRPGIVCASLSAYGRSGPWSNRRGFDSLVQTATGLNLAEAQAFGESSPRALPFQVLDYAAGYLLAYGIQVALLRQATRGGSWQVHVSLAGVANWLRGLGRPEGGLHAHLLKIEPFVQSVDSGWGRLSVVRHAAQFSQTPACWHRPSVRPGHDAPRWWV